MKKTDNLMYMHKQFYDQLGNLLWERHSLGNRQRDNAGEIKTDKHNTRQCDECVRRGTK